MTTSIDSAPITYRSWPEVGEPEREAVERVLASGVLSGALAPEVAALEDEWNELIGSQHTISTASGTAALVVAFSVLAARAEPHRREVIVPAYTFGATVAAVLLAGLKPRFVEVDPATFNMDPRHLATIDPTNVVAVAPVHLFGLPCDIDEIIAWARANGVAVVEDCAQAHLASFHGQTVGTFGDFACFSLQSSKHLGAGEGGLLSTPEAELADAARSMCSFGFAVDDGGVVRRDDSRDGYSVYREHLTNGGMHRLQELPAAIARAKLPRLADRIAAVQTLAERFFDQVGDLPGLIVPPRPPDRTHVFHKIRIGVDAGVLAPGRGAGEVREEFRARLHANGLETTLWQMPIMPLHTAFAPFAGERDWATSPSQAAVEQSFILFSEDRPLIAQDSEFVDAAAPAFRRAWEEFAAGLG